MPVCVVCGFVITDQTAFGSFPAEVFDAAGRIIAVDLVHRLHQRINGVLQPVLELT